MARLVKTESWQDKFFNIKKNEKYKI